jgi:hypothetical protein
MSARVLPHLLLTLALAASTGGGSARASAGTPPTGREEAFAYPVPSVTLDASLDEQAALGVSSVVASRLLWEPCNWKVNSDSTTQVQNEEQVVVNPSDPDNLVAVWRDFRLGYRRVGVGYSFDAGITWHDSLLEEPTYPRHSDPGITSDAYGNFYTVILSYTGSTAEPNGLFVFKSEDGGVTWGDPVPVIDGVAGVFEDKELIGCDRTGGAFDGNLYVTWARFGQGTDIMCSRSTDGGASFDAPILLSDKSGVQWPVPVVGPDGTLYIGWAQYQPSRIMIDRSYDGGETFGGDITLADTYTAQTELNGGISVFSFPAMDCDITGGEHDGRLYAAYMDLGGDDYDILFSYSDDRGDSWSPSARINDDTYGNGCDQFHPWTCVSPDGVVTVVFYDRRNDPSNMLMDLYMAQSFDGGLTFEPNVRVSTVSSDPTAGSARAGLLGEYIGLAASSAGRVHPVWTDTREGNQDVYTSVFDTTFVGVAGDLGGSGVVMAPPRPNPSADSVTLAFTAPGRSGVAIRIFDVNGRLVRALRCVSEADGTGRAVWDGADAAGNLVGAGVYFATVEAGSATGAAKLVLVR